MMYMLNVITKWDLGRVNNGTADVVVEDAHARMGCEW